MNKYTLYDKLKKVSEALYIITNQECCDYGFEEACDIAGEITLNGIGHRDDSSKAILNEVQSLIEYCGCNQAKRSRIIERLKKLQDELNANLPFD